MKAPAPRCIAPTGAERTRFGERPRYAEGLYALGAGLFAWLVPNGSWGESNAGLVVGEGQSLLIDTLWDRGHTRAMLAAMQPHVAAAPVLTIVNTHADGDHCWGNALLPDAEIVASEQAARDMAAETPSAMIMFERLGKAMRALPFSRARQAGHYFAAMCAPYDFPDAAARRPDRTFSGETTLDIGGRTVRVIEAGPAHTHGDAMVHVPDAGTLFAGDLIFVDSTPVMWAGPVETWLAALETILDLDVETIVPGHGPVTGKDGVRAMRDYWHFVSEAARDRYEKGEPPVSAARAIAGSATFRALPFARWDSPERIVTSVHTLYRHWRGTAAQPGKLATVNILRQQAHLANDIAGGRPLSMRLGGTAADKSK